MRTEQNTGVKKQFQNVLILEEGKNFPKKLFRTHFTSLLYNQAQFLRARNHIITHYVKHLVKPPIVSFNILNLEPYYLLCL